MRLHQKQKLEQSEWCRMITHLEIHHNGYNFKQLQPDLMTSLQVVAYYSSYRKINHTGHLGLLQAMQTEFRTAREQQLSTKMQEDGTSNSARMTRTPSFLALSTNRKALCYLPGMDCDLGSIQEVLSINGNNLEHGHFHTYLSKQDCQTLNSLETLLHVTACGIDLSVDLQMGRKICAGRYVKSVAVVDHVPLRVNGTVLSSGLSGALNVSADEKDAIALSMCGGFFCSRMPIIITFQPNPNTVGVVSMGHSMAECP